VFENRVLRKIFWRQRDEVTGEWRKLHNGELYDLYCPTNIVRVIKSGGMRDRGSTYRVLMRRPDGKSLLGRTMNRWGIILKCVLKKWDG
jgi:hypothetical protein